MRLKEIIDRQIWLKNNLAISNTIIRILREKYIKTQFSDEVESITNDEGQIVPEEDIEKFCQMINDDLMSDKRRELEKLYESDLVSMVIAQINENPDLLPFQKLKKEAKG